MRPNIPREIPLEIEKGSLLSNLDTIGPSNDLGGDFMERKIILLRYPARKAPQI